MKLLSDGEIRDWKREYQKTRSSKKELPVRLLGQGVFANGRIKTVTDSPSCIPPRVPPQVPSVSRNKRKSVRRRVKATSTAQIIPHKFQICLRKLTKNAATTLVYIILATAANDYLDPSNNLFELHIYLTGTQTRIARVLAHKEASLFDIRKVLELKNNSSGLLYRRRWSFKGVEVSPMLLEVEKEYVQMQSLVDQSRVNVEVSRDRLRLYAETEAAYGRSVIYKRREELEYHLTLLEQLTNSLALLREASESWKRVCTCLPSTPYCCPYYFSNGIPTILREDTDRRLVKGNGVGRVANMFSDNKEVIKKGLQASVVVAATPQLSESRHKYQSCILWITFLDHGCLKDTTDICNAKQLRDYIANDHLNQEALDWLTNSEIISTPYLLMIPDDITQRTPLHHAAFYNNIPIFMHLCKSNVDLAALDCRGQTALHIASEKGHCEIASIILKSFVMETASDQSSCTSYGTAREDGGGQNLSESQSSDDIYKETTKKDLSKGVSLLRRKIGCFSPNVLPTDSSTAGGAQEDPKSNFSSAFRNMIHVQRQKALLIKEEIVSPGSRSLLDIRDVNSFTPFELALKNRHTDLVKIFLQVEPELLTTTEYYEGVRSILCPLEAVKSSNFSTLDLWYTHLGWQPGQTDDISGRTLLHWAAHYGNASLCRWLMDQQGENPYDVCDSGMAPIHIAASQGYVETVSAFYEKKRNVCVRVRQKPSHSADFSSASGFTPQMRRLLSVVASKDFPDYDLLSLPIATTGDTPLHLALSQTRNRSMMAELCELIINETNTDILSSNIEFQNVLHVACAERKSHELHKIIQRLVFLETPELLCKVINATDIDGDTPLAIATRNHSIECAAVLLKLDSLDTTILVSMERQLLLFISQVNASKADFSNTAKQIIKKCVDQDSNSVTNTSGIGAYRMTPLQAGIRQSDVFIVSQLLAVGADVLQVDESGEIPLALACKYPVRNFEIIIQLLANNRRAMGTTEITTLVIHEICRSRPEYLIPEEPIRRKVRTVVFQNNSSCHSEMTDITFSDNLSLESSYGDGDIELASIHEHDPSPSRISVRRVTLTDSVEYPGSSFALLCAPDTPNSSSFIPESVITPRLEVLYHPEGLPFVSISVVRPSVEDYRSLKSLKPIKEITPPINVPIVTKKTDKKRIAAEQHAVKCKRIIEFVLLLVKPDFKTCGATLLKQTGGVLNVISQLLNAGLVLPSEPDGDGSVATVAMLRLLQYAIQNNLLEENTISNQTTQHTLTAINSILDVDTQLGESQSSLPTVRNTCERLYQRGGRYCESSKIATLAAKCNLWNLIDTALGDPKCCWSWTGKDLGSKNVFHFICRSGPSSLLAKVCRRIKKDETIKLITSRDRSGLTPLGCAIARLSLTHILELLVLSNCGNDLYDITSSVVSNGYSTLRLEPEPIPNSLLSETIPGSCHASISELMSKISHHDTGSHAADFIRETFTGYQVDDCLLQRPTDIFKNNEISYKSTTRSNTLFSSLPLTSGRRLCQQIKCALIQSGHLNMNLDFRVLLYAVINSDSVLIRCLVKIFISHSVDTINNCIRDEKPKFLPKYFENGTTALYIASLLCNRDCVFELLQCPWIDVHAGSNSDTPLSAAFRGGSLVVGMLLLTAGAFPNSTPDNISLRCYVGSYSIHSGFVSQKGNQISIVSGATPLLLFIRSLNTVQRAKKSLSVLLSRGCVITVPGVPILVNQQAVTGDNLIEVSPIHVMLEALPVNMCQNINAVYKEVINQLLENSPISSLRLSVLDIHENNVVESAILKTCFDFATFLVRLGTPVWESGFAIHMFCSKIIVAGVQACINQIEFMSPDEVLKRLNSKDATGLTPLMHAVRYDSVASIEIIKLLLNQGCSTEPRDKLKRTALMKFARVGIFQDVCLIASEEDLIVKKTRPQSASTDIKGKLSQPSNQLPPRPQSVSVTGTKTAQFRPCFLEDEQASSFCDESTETELSTEKRIIPSNRLTEVDINNWTLLHHAIVSNNTNCVVGVIPSGLPSDLRTKILNTGISPLYLAAELGNELVAMQLLPMCLHQLGYSKGNGETVIHIAAKNQLRNLTARLLQTVEGYENYFGQVSNTPDCKLNALCYSILFGGMRVLSPGSTSQYIFSSFQDTDDKENTSLSYILNNQWIYPRYIYEDLCNSPVVRGAYPEEACFFLSRGLQRHTKCSMQRKLERSIKDKDDHTCAALVKEGEDDLRRVMLTGLPTPDVLRSNIARKQQIQAFSDPENQISIPTLSECSEKLRSSLYRLIAVSFSNIKEFSLSHETRSCTVTLRYARQAAKLIDTNTVTLLDSFKLKTQKSKNIGPPYRDSFKQSCDNIIHTCALEGFQKTLNVVLKSDLDEEDKTLTSSFINILNMRDSHGYTALHYSVAKSRYQISTTLIKSGALIVGVRDTVGGLTAADIIPSYKSYLKLSLYLKANPSAFHPLVFVSDETAVAMRQPVNNNINISETYQKSIKNNRHNKYHSSGAMILPGDCVDASVPNWSPNLFDERMTLADVRMMMISTTDYKLGGRGNDKMALALSKRVLQVSDIALLSSVNAQVLDVHNSLIRTAEEVMQFNTNSPVVQLQSELTDSRSSHVNFINSSELSKSVYKHMLSMFSIFVNTASAESLGKSDRMRALTVCSYGIGGGCLGREILNTLSSLIRNHSVYGQMCTLLVKRIEILFVDSRAKVDDVNKSTPTITKTGLLTIPVFCDEDIIYCWDLYERIDQFFSLNAVSAVKLASDAYRNLIVNCEENTKGICPNISVYINDADDSLFSQLYNASMQNDDNAIYNLQQTIQSFDDSSKVQQRAKEVFLYMSQTTAMVENVIRDSLATCQLINQQTLHIVYHRGSWDENTVDDDTHNIPKLKNEFHNSAVDVLFKQLPQSTRESFCLNPLTTETAAIASQKSRKYAMSNLVNYPYPALAALLKTSINEQVNSVVASCQHPSLLVEVVPYGKCFKELRWCNPRNLNWLELRKRKLEEYASCIPTRQQQQQRVSIDENINSLPSDTNGLLLLWNLVKQTISLSKKCDELGLTIPIRNKESSSLSPVLFLIYSYSGFLPQLCLLRSVSLSWYYVINDLLTKSEVHESQLRTYSYLKSQNNSLEGSKRLREFDVLISMSVKDVKTLLIRYQFLISGVDKKQLGIEVPGIFF